MVRLLVIAAAGAVGTLCRYGTGVLARKITEEWPLGTVVVNVVGCFVLALLSESVLRGARVNEELRFALGIGFCGGLTTYSTFNQDALMLFKNNGALVAAGYVALTLILCAAASLAGVGVAHALVDVAG